MSVDRAARQREAFTAYYETRTGRAVADAVRKYADDRDPVGSSIIDMAQQAQQIAEEHPAVISQAAGDALVDGLIAAFAHCPDTHNCLCRIDNILSAIFRQYPEDVGVEALRLIEETYKRLPGPIAILSQTLGHAWNLKCERLDMSMLWDSMQRGTS